jgi:hypothetical protein
MKRMARTNSSLVSLRSLARPENGAPKLGMPGSLHENVLGKESYPSFAKAIGSCLGVKSARVS